MRCFPISQLVQYWESLESLWIHCGPCCAGTLGLGLELGLPQVAVAPTLGEPGGTVSPVVAELDEEPPDITVNPALGESA